MSEIKDIFYNLFWQNKSCRNLFLLSKEELLDTKTLEMDGENRVSVSFPRIIISNANKDSGDHNTIKIRTETDIIRSQASIESKFKKYKPLITNFLETRFGKALNHIIEETNESPKKILKLIFKYSISNKIKKEKILLEELQRHGFIGKNINSFKDLEKHTNNDFQKGLKSFLTEETLWNILEFCKSIKDIYGNLTFSDMYSSNQVLVNTLFGQDDFESRIKMFDQLFDLSIITSSTEDSFVECVHCPQSSYRGMIRIKISPGKLNKLICPICNHELNYYVPYQLNNDLFETIKSKDGIILDALCNRLTKSKITFETNLTQLGNIELDCLFKRNGITYIVECKMYKQSSSTGKLKEKINEHYLKLLQDIHRLSTSLNRFSGPIIPILLVNVPDREFLNSIKDAFTTEVPDVSGGKSLIVNIEDFPY